MSKRIIYKRLIDLTFLLLFFVVGYIAGENNAQKQPGAFIVRLCEIDTLDEILGEGHIIGETDSIRFSSANYQVEVLRTK